MHAPVVDVRGLVSKADRIQQRSRGLGFAFGVVKKFGDDRGGQLAALVTYYGFLSLFPLLLLLVTVLGLVAGSRSSWATSVEHSSLAQFPVIGNQIAANLHELHRRSAVGLVVGLAGLVWGSQGASQAGQFAMAQVWNIPAIQRPGFGARLVRSLALLGVLGVFLGLSTVLAAGASFAGHQGVWLRVLGIVLTLVANLVLFVLAFRILTPAVVGTRDLVAGAALGAAGWTVLQVFGTFVIDHTLRSTSQVYGFFAIVLGLLAWIFLGAQLTMYAAEVNVVRARRLWPRSMAPPPLTPADEEVFAALATQEARRPEQSVWVAFEGRWWAARRRPRPGAAAPDGGPPANPSAAPGDPVGAGQRTG